MHYLQEHKRYFTQQDRKKSEPKWFRVRQMPEFDAKEVFKSPRSFAKAYAVSHVETRVVVLFEKDPEHPCAFMSQETYRAIMEKTW